MTPKEKLKSVVIEYLEQFIKYDCFQPVFTIQDNEYKIEVDTNCFIVLDWYDEYYVDVETVTPERTVSIDDIDQVFLGKVYNKLEEMSTYENFIKNCTSKIESKLIKNFSGG